MTETPASRAILCGRQENTLVGKRHSSVHGKPVKVTCFHRGNVSQTRSSKTKRYRVLVTFETLLRLTAGGVYQGGDPIADR